jgi:dipeptidyl aminopeptidase/acylaminoacyl peptidase
VRALIGLPAALALAAAALAELPPKIPVRDLFSNPSVSGPQLSDDGKTYAFVASDGDKQVIFSMGVENGSRPTPLARVDDPENRLAWIAWANADRLLISGQARNPNAVFVRARVRRLFGVNRDGSDFDWLGRRWPLFGQLQLPVTYQDQVIHWTPDDPDGVLLQYWPPYDEAPKVVRMDVVTGRVRTTQGAAKKIRSWHADAEGHVRAGEAVTPSNLYQLYARIEPKGDLERVIEHPVFGDASGPVFAGFHADPAKIYVMALHEGKDAIFEFDLRTRAVGPVVFSHPEVDVDGLQREPGAERRVVGAHYIVDRPAIHFFDAKAEAEHQALGRALQREFDTPVFHERVSVSGDGALQIYAVSSEIEPPSYYLFDRSTHSLSHILDQRPKLKPEMLAPTKRVTFRARDGLEIPAYVTLPRGVEPKNLPAVVNVHGGPWSRDWIQWDPEVQLLANRGFAVLQLNFRGSSGLGRKHLESGYREWGQKIQDDITDGVKWLIAEGIADPDRIGITGGSYGGFATLVGLTKTPELYRAGAAYASVTDIEFLISDDKWYDWGADWHETMVGGGHGDKDRLRAVSPLRHAANVRVPVLLGHGVDDQRVHVRQSQRMAKALREAGKDVAYLEFPNEIHGFLLEANRIRWCEALIAFFEKNLAPREASPPAAVTAQGSGAAASP